MTLAEQLYCLSRPNRPLAQETTNKAPLNLSVSSLESERSKEIQNDVIIISGIKSDILAPRFRHGAKDVERLIAIKRRDLDRHDIVNFNELAPERIGEYPPARGRLQIEADDWNDRRHAPAMGEQLLRGRGFERSQAQQRRVVAIIAKKYRFEQRLIRGTTDAADSDNGRTHQPLTLESFLGD
jgi:hypothetical protein